MQLSLKVQKYIFFSSIILFYIFVLGLFFIYPSSECINSNKISSFGIPYYNETGRYCYIYDITIFIYNIILISIMGITIISSNKSNKNSEDLEWVNIKNPPKVLIFIPCYKEEKEIIQNSIDSVVNDNYPVSEKIIFIVSDGIDKTKKNILEILDCRDIGQYCEDETNSFMVYSGVYKKCTYIIVTKEKNRGKKDSFLIVQKYISVINEKENNRVVISMFREQGIPSRNYINRNSDTIEYIFEKKNFNEEIKYILMLDTDTELTRQSIENLVIECEKDDKILGTCGETKVKNKGKNLITMSQEFEYWITHLTLKSIESYLENVLVLSGCLSLYRVKPLLNKDLIKEYKGKKINTNIYRGNIEDFGEDRFLTNLLLKYNKDMKTTYIKSSKCRTTVPETVKSLFQQRKRWTNSLLFCNIMLLFNTPDYDFEKRLFFVLVVFFQIYLCLMFPLLISISIYIIIYNIINGFSSIILIQTLIFIFIPVILCFIFGNLGMIRYSIPFIILTPIYNIFIPIYSIYYSDDFQW